MGFLETIGLAFRNLWANRLRTMLSALGIVIGVASVITMISVGTSAERRIASEIAGLGSNMILVTPKIGRGAKSASSPSLTIEMAEELKAAAPAVSAVSPVAQIEGQLRWASSSTNTSIIGITSDYMRIANQSIVRGRSLIPAEVDSAAKSIILGAKTASALFEDEDPIGREIGVVAAGRRFDFTVVGVVAAKSDMLFMNSDSQAFVPITCLLYRMMPIRGISMYYCQAQSPEMAGPAVAQVERYLASRTGNPGAFNVGSQEALLDAVHQVTSTMTLLLGIIAGISLLVGGIGIMNTLLTSVAERTREIGIRKSLGARNRDILLQFLVEALALSLIGGAIGMILGWMAGSGISRLAGWPPSFSMTSVAAAVGFSSAVGLIFGIFPAVKAAQMNPVDALRYE
ncbi:MAG TPA: ABC transporter permease [Bacillota bacterium]|jgi:putative ABC transport system permease protein|nr:ABC transporter permease [Bacillota bacterium]HOK70593.1 ABC transporter permease [Bacillota bacterium]HOL52616.1 ABC transporter permease [Bacillota bacterium]HOO30069.1 ABC transporter permease [Bacillota bacterium]HPZ12856.1 ABC transporter permease [Bacillota bacterium]